jgi:iron complex transport system ATP-binding protein
MTALSLHNVTVTLGNRDILKAVSFTIARGKMVGLLGPNGAGKTTAVRALLGLQNLTSGRASIGDTISTKLNSIERARNVSYLPQARHMAWPIGVREAVSLGRFAYGGPMGRLSGIDQIAVDAALDRCDLKHLQDRSVASLSGGELARVHIARALASQTPAIIADEPIAELDPGHALDVLALLQSRARDNVAVLVILHDLSLAAAFCDEIILLHDGACVCQGPPRDVLTPKTLAHVYNINAQWQDGILSILGKV